MRNPCVVFIVSPKAKILHERYILRLQDGQASSVTGTHTHRPPSQLDCRRNLVCSSLADILFHLHGTPVPSNYGEATERTDRNNKSTAAEDELISAFYFFLMFLLRIKQSEK